MIIKAIETAYKGYRFRSRLEARWAVFFDALGVAWEYEKEGFELPSGRYLPDFWLPKLDCWIEIKPVEPSARESAMAAQLAEATRRPVFLFYGQVPGYDLSGGLEDGFGQSGEMFTPGGWDNYYAFCVCDSCGLVDIQFEGRSNRMKCKECYACCDKRHGIDVSNYLAKCHSNDCEKRCHRTEGNPDRGHTYDHDRIVNAIAAARSARFEHGETPTP